MNNLKKKKKGFTLIELMAVIAIVAILAAVLVPTVSGYITRARKTAAVTQIRNAANAISSYNITSSTLIPVGTSETGSDALITTIVKDYKEAGGTQDNLIPEVQAGKLTSAELLYEKDIDLINNLKIYEIIILNSKEDILDRITIAKDNGKYVVAANPKTN